MTIETILCCFVADEEMFPANQRFADGGLAEVISSSAATALSASPVVGGAVAAPSASSPKVAPIAQPIENHLPQ